MAHGQLGQKQQARQWYDKAVEWMEEKQPKDKEVGRFRAKAAELLGVIETPPERPAEEEKTDVKIDSLPPNP